MTCPYRLFLRDHAHFNSHAHVERDLDNLIVKSNKYSISTHTLTWSVTTTGLKRGDNNTDFNSHAHVERDHLTKYFCSLLRISTHTLTWSVTIPELVTVDFGTISTHTLTWSVTLSIWVNALMEKNFNSHAHVERDLTIVFCLLSLAGFQLTRSRGA